MAYTVLGELKSYLGIAPTTIADDALLTTIIGRAQSAIDAYCDRTFEAAADTTRYFDALCDVDARRRTLYLDEDLCQITTVLNGDGQAVASTRYVTEPRNRKPWHVLRMKRDADVYWTFDDTPEDAIAVTGRWAYSIVAPPDIVHATLRLSAYLYRQKDNAGDLDRPVSIGSNMMLMPPQLPDDLAAMLAPYRRLV